MTENTSRDFFTASAWVLQNLVYLAARSYFKYIKHIQISCHVEIERLRKPVIVAAAPHMAHLDVMVIPAALPRHQLPVRWLADQKIFDNTISSFWFKLWGAIPVNRDHDGSFQSDDIDWILEFALQGNCIGLFPECCLVGNQFGKHHQHIICQAIHKQIKVVPAVLKNLAVADTGLMAEHTGKLSKYRVYQQTSRPQVIISKPLESCVDLLDSLAV